VVSFICPGLEVAASIFNGPSEASTGTSAVLWTIWMPEFSIFWYSAWDRLEPKFRFSAKAQRPALGSKVVPQYLGVGFDFSGHVIDVSGDVLLDVAGHACHKTSLVVSQRMFHDALHGLLDSKRPSPFLDPSLECVLHPLGTVRMKRHTSSCNILDRSTCFAPQSCWVFHLFSNLVQTSFKHDWQTVGAASVPSPLPCLSHLNASQQHRFCLGSLLSLCILVAQ
jgi:hypothetical protein